MSLLTKVFSSAPPEVRAALVQLITGDTTERAAAAEALARLGHEPAASVLRERIAEEHPQVARSFLGALAKLAPDVATQTAADLLLCGTPELAKVGRSFLRQHAPAHEARLQNLIVELASPDPQARKRAAEDLISFGDKRAIRALLGHLADPSPEVLRVILEGVSALAPQKAPAIALKALFTAPNRDCMRVAAEVLLPLDLSILLDVMLCETEQWRVSAELVARSRLAQAVATCRRWLGVRDKKCRRDAVEILGKIAVCVSSAKDQTDRREARRLIRTLARSFYDPKPLVRCEVLRWLSEARCPEARELAQKALKDPHPDCRTEALRALGRSGQPSDLPSVLELLHDPKPSVREAAFVAAKTLATEPLELVRGVRRMLDDKDSEIRAHAIEILVKQRETRMFPLVLRKLRDKDPEIRVAALRAAHTLAPNRQEWLKVLRRVLKRAAHTLARNRQASRTWFTLVRKMKQHLPLLEAALDLAREGGYREVLDEIHTFFHDPDDDIQTAALDAAASIAPERATEFALSLVTGHSPRATELALSILEERAPDQVVDLVLQKLRRARLWVGLRFLDFIETKAPERFPEAVRLALRSRCSWVRARAARELPKVMGEDCKATLRNMLKDRDCDVRRAAFETLCEVAPEQTVELALEALDDEDDDVRWAALKALADHDDPRLVESILPLARDESASVRRLAIRILRRFDDPRVASELVSSVNDVEEDVRKEALAILRGERGPVPALNRLKASLGHQGDWQHLRRRVEEVNRWAQRVGSELLGKPVIVQNYRQGLGRTHRGSQHVVIKISDSPLTSGHPHGADIMRGLALHEIGHHLCERAARALKGIARSEGVEDIYDYLRDERLERILRARRPEWGIYFDRLTSYAFANQPVKIHLADYAALTSQAPDQVREAIARGDLPGELIPRPVAGGPELVRLRAWDVLMLPGAVQPLPAFAYCLRTGFDPARVPDPRIARAIALVPKNLKDLDLPEVLEVARRIADIIGRQNNDQLEAWLRHVRRVRRIWAALSKLLRRLADTGNLPPWLQQGAPGIRTNQPPPLKRQPRSVASRTPGTTRYLNLGSRRDFPPLRQERELRADPAAQACLVASIRPHIRRLRAHFERLSTRPIEVPASRRGHRIDIPQARRAAVVPTPNLLVFGAEEQATDAYIGILIDCSNSMEGEKLERAKAFGALVAESARGIRGLVGHVNAFDDETFYRLGDFRRNAIPALTAGEGNNDAGALARAADLALQSRKRNKLIIMISDGLPTECTLESLKNLVADLTSDYGIVCVQAAVEAIEEPAFPHYVDFSKYPFDEAVARFGALVMRLTQEWR